MQDLTPAGGATYDPVLPGPVRDRETSFWRLGEQGDDVTSDSILSGPMHNRSPVR